jgi:hypothetical protein
LAGEHSVETAFQDEMERICRNYEKLTGKRPQRFLNMVRADGAVATAHHFLSRPMENISSGLEEVVDHDRLDLTLEHVVLEEPFRSALGLTDAELQRAEGRMAVLREWVRMRKSRA